MEASTRPATRPAPATRLEPHGRIIRIPSARAVGSARRVTHLTPDIIWISGSGVYWGGRSASDEGQKSTKGACVAFYLEQTETRTVSASGGETVETANTCHFFGNAWELSGGLSFSARC